MQSPVRVGILFGGVLLGTTACRIDYLVEPHVLAEAQSQPNPARVAVGVRPVDEADSLYQPLGPSQGLPIYVKADALRRALTPLGARYWKVSALDARRHKIPGVVLVGIGLASLLGGTLYASLGNNQPCNHAPDCNWRGIGIALYAGPAFLAGFIETLTGSILLGISSVKTEVPIGQPGMRYMPPPY